MQNIFIKLLLIELFISYYHTILKWIYTLLKLGYNIYSQNKYKSFRKIDTSQNKSLEWIS